MAGDGFDLRTTYVQLEDGPAATHVPVDDAFWARIDERPALHEGRLVMAFEMTADWTTWEMHPEGDELLILTAGGMRMTLEEDGAERTVELCAPCCFVVPRGAWHTADIADRCELVAVTRGKGTQHRPR